MLPGPFQEGASGPLGRACLAALCPDRVPTSRGRLPGGMSIWGWSWVPPVRLAGCLCPVVRTQAGGLPGHAERRPACVERWCPSGLSAVGVGISGIVSWGSLSAELSPVAGRSLGAPESLRSSPATPEPSFRGGPLSLWCCPPAVVFGPDWARGVVWPCGGHWVTKGAAPPGVQLCRAGEDGLGDAAEHVAAVSNPGPLDAVAGSYLRFSAPFCCTRSPTAAPAVAVCCHSCPWWLRGGHSFTWSCAIGAQCPQTQQPPPFGHLHPVCCFPWPTAGCLAKSVRWGLLASSQLMGPHVPTAQREALSHKRGTAEPECGLRLSVCP